MTVKLHKNNSWMGGVDSHKMNSEFDPFLVGTKFSDPSNGKRTSNVTADGELMIQEGFENMLVPHYPLAPPATTAAAALYAAILLGASTKPILSVASVQGNGRARACEMWMWVGLNLNCFRPFNAPSGATMTIGSVETEPTLADWVRCGLNAAISSAVSWVVGQFATSRTDGLDAVLKPIVQLMIKQSWKWVVKPLWVDPWSKPLGKEIDKVIDTALS